MNKILDYKNKLLKGYDKRIELHAHTSPVSRCSQVSPAEMARTYHEKGYDAIVITNHFVLGWLDGKTKEEQIDWYLSDYEETKKEALKYGMTVILGAEIRFTENTNDYLIFGVNRDVLSVCYDYLDKGLKVFRKEVKLPDSVFIQAHPFRDNIEVCDPSLLDGMETFNMHPGHNSRVGIAVRYAAENGLKITLPGSDFHHPNKGHEAVSALRTKTVPKDSYELAKLIKTGDYIFEIGENALVLP